MITHIFVTGGTDINNKYFQYNNIYYFHFYKHDMSNYSLRDGFTQIVLDGNISPDIHVSPSFTWIQLRKPLSSPI